MSSDRVLLCEGIHNFRDYGGYAVPGEGRVRRGVLWRSGQHYAATLADLATIAALDLAAVYDLRSERERESHPCRRPEGFGARIVTINEEPQALAPHVAAGAAVGAGAGNGADAGAGGGAGASAGGRGRKRDAASSRDAMRRSYRNLPFRPGLVAMMRQYLADHGHLEGASLINCMAGKDRTGFAVAMLHASLGVHRDDIVEDYLLTNTAGDPAARIAAGGEAIRDTVGDLDPDVLAVLMGVEAEYLDIALAEVSARHGSLDGYLEAVLGVDAVARERLRARLVEA